MRVRWQWIIGLIVLVIADLASCQGETAKEGETKAETNATDVSTKPPLTGNPQIDYIHDPNLPHELKTYDLSDYPFYSRLPEDLLLPSFNFTCDDRLDGFYASVVHKCQVYHNCLFGQRYDFLCANYTVFDQKNFICHYVSEVDCPNSAKHYDRNEELYVTTTTSTTTRAPPQIIYVDRPSRPARPLGGPGLIRPRPRPFANKRRPNNRRTTTTPAPDYYDDYYYGDYYDQYYDNYYYDYANDKTTTTTTTTTQRPRRPNRPHRKGRPRPPGRFGNVKDRKRPRINPPVPLDDEQGGQRPRASRLQQSRPARQQAVDEARVDEDEPRQGTGQDGPSGTRRHRPGRKPRPGPRPVKKTTTTTSTTTTTEAAPEDYYDYYYDYADEPSSTTTSTTAAPTRPSRPSFSRTRPGGSQRGRPTPTATTTTTTTTEAPTTEAPRDRGTRPGRVNARNNPLSSRRTPIEGALPIDEPQEAAPTQETAGSQRQRPQRLRPQFPRKRPQSQSSSTGQETEIIDEAPPLTDGAPVDTTEDPEVSNPVRNRPGVSRTPIRRAGQSGAGRQRSGQGIRGQRRPPPPTPDYQDY